MTQFSTLSTKWFPYIQRNWLKNSLDNDQHCTQCKEKKICFRNIVLLTIALFNRCLTDVIFGLLTFILSWCMIQVNFDMTDSIGPGKIGLSYAKSVVYI